MKSLKNRARIYSTIFCVCIGLHCYSSSQNEGRIFIDGKSLSTASENRVAGSRLQRFTPDNIARIDTGLSPLQIEKILGPPDMKFNTSFGKKSGSQWPGLVYIYHLVPDPLYEKINVFKSNTFIFAQKQSTHVLRDFNLEYIHRNN